MKWYGEQLMKNEQEYRAKNSGLFERSKKDFEALRKYWSGKSWLSDATLKKLKRFFQQIEPRISALEIDIDMNVIPLALVYLAWTEEVPSDAERLELINFVRSRSARDWRRVRKAINHAK